MTSLKNGKRDDVCRIKYEVSAKKFPRDTAGDET